MLMDRRSQEERVDARTAHALEAKWFVQSEDVPLFLALILHLMAAHVECVMDATLMDEAVLTANASHTRQTTASFAPV